MKWLTRGERLIILIKYEYIEFALCLPKGIKFKANTKNRKMRSSWASAEAKLKADSRRILTHFFLWKSHEAFAPVCLDVTLCEAWSSIHLQACRCFTFLIRIQQSRLKFSALLIIVFANAKTIMSRGQAARLPDPAGKLVWLKAKVHPNDF